MNKYRVVHYIYERNDIKSIKREELEEVTIEADTFAIENRCLIFRVDGRPVAAFNSWEKVIKIEE
jgi:hypothetical protein